MIYGFVILAGFLVSLLGVLGLKTDYQERLKLAEKRADDFYLKESLVEENKKMLLEVKSKSEAEAGEKEALENLDVCMQKMSAIRSEAEGKNDEVTKLKNQLALAWRELDRSKHAARVAAPANKVPDEPAKVNPQTVTPDITK